jgi:hypothetical protein
MLAKYARLIGTLAGSVLGSLAISAQVGNVLICVAVIFLGPAVILNRLA